MRVRHPSPEIPQGLVDKIVARRGRLHAYQELDPARTALVAIDLDAASCAREPAATDIVIRAVNMIARALRAAGGAVAFVTSTIGDPEDLEARLGTDLATTYSTDTQPGGNATLLDPRLEPSPGDVRSVKTGASAFFPGRCDLHESLAARNIRYLLISGLVTNICCESSGRDAHELGYRVTMVSDAMVGHSFGLHESSLSTFYRFFGDVRPTEDVLGMIDRARVAGDASAPRHNQP